MTMSSQMQLLASNPVPLIGTRFLNNNNNFTNTSNTTNTRDSVNVTGGIDGIINGRFRQRLANKVSSSPKRCLFGKAENGEIQKLFDAQNEQNRKHFLNKYNFDIYATIQNNNNNIQISNSNTENICNNTSGISDNNCKDETNLIELELRDYRNRLAADESNNKSNTDRRDDFKCNSVKNNISLLNKDTKCNQQRNKPYKRQTSLTEYYRQTSSCGSSIKTIQVTEMPKSQRAKLLMLKQEEKEEQRLQKDQENQHKSTPPPPHFDSA